MRVLTLSETIKIGGGNNTYSNNFNYLEAFGALTLGALLAGGIGFLATGFKYSGLVTGAAAGGTVFFLLDGLSQEIAMW